MYNILEKSWSFTNLTTLFIHFFKKSLTFTFPPRRNILIQALVREVPLQMLLHFPSVHLKSPRNPQERLLATSYWHFAAKLVAIQAPWTWHCAPSPSCSPEGQVKLSVEWCKQFKKTATWTPAWHLWVVATYTLRWYTQPCTLHLPTSELRLIRSRYS